MVSGKCIQAVNYLQDMSALHATFASRCFGNRTSRPMRSCITVSTNCAEEERLNSASKYGNALAMQWRSMESDVGVVLAQQSKTDPII